MFIAYMLQNGVFCLGNELLASKSSLPVIILYKGEDFATSLGYTCCKFAD